MKLRLLLSLSLLWLAWPESRAENPDDIFYGGAVNYLSNNIPKALEVVTNGRALFPDDIKLKKLEELLKQQQQQKNEQQEQDKKQDQQSKQDQQKQPTEQKDQENQEQQGHSKPKPEEKEESRDAQSMQAHAMSPQEARQLLDAQKAEEAMIPLKPEGKPENRERAFKDW
jgi:hypothetical protein